jgi:ArsR family transcriptional regulator
MPTLIDRDQLRRVVAEGAQLVDVLPPDEHAEAHLPGALSIPLFALDRRRAARLRRDRPVVVYCHDTQ